MNGLFIGMNVINDGPSEDKNECLFIGMDELFICLVIYSKTKRNMNVMF